MKIHSNFYYEDKTYETEIDMVGIQKLIDSAVANNKKYHLLYRNSYKSKTGSKI